MFCTKSRCTTAHYVTAALATDHKYLMWTSDDFETDNLKALDLLSVIVPEAGVAKK